MFTIALDPDAPLLRISLEGFWSAAVVEQFINELTNTVDRHPSSAIAGAIIDARQMHVQSMDVGALLQSRITALQPRLNGRAALIVPTGIARLQAQRLFPSAEKSRMFETEEEGRAWVLGA